MGFSRAQLEALPLKTLETLCQLILSEVEPVTPLDFWLCAVIAMEELAQYNASTLISEDLALLEAHPTPGVHGELFRPVRDKDRLVQVLASQGYRTDWFDLLPEEDPYRLYWLCRRTTVIFPWQMLLKSVPKAYPYLSRLKAIETYLIDMPDLSASMLLQFQVYPVKALILLEGATEALLIPAMAQALGYNLQAEGIEAVAVGGKNQMLENYVYYAERLNGPICIVLDKDAEPLLPDLSYYRRPQDRIFVLQEGEFEDLYAMDWIVQTVNEHYQPDQEMTENHFAQATGGRVETLQILWQELGLGEFNKVAFAEKLAETLTHERLMSPAMKRLITDIIETKRDAR